MLLLIHFSRGILIEMPWMVAFSFWICNRVTLQLGDDKVFEGPRFNFIPLIFSSNSLSCIVAITQLLYYIPYICYSHDKCLPCQRFWTIAAWIRKTYWQFPNYLYPCHLNNWYFLSNTMHLDRNLLYSGTTS